MLNGSKLLASFSKLMGNSVNYYSESAFCKFQGNILYFQKKSTRIKCNRLLSGAYNLSHTQPINKTSTKATGLISSLFNIASYYQSLPLFYLSSIPFSTAVQVTICGMRIMALVQNQGMYRATRGTSCIILCLECCPHPLLNQ